ncbi:MAG: flagellar hook capping protein [Thiomicrospira sp.]|uniref:flagellar hook assembly protein FlgD n=1 Tax=Thiomicrospira sp. TaxID=935 RepID=UPI001A0FDC4C|nr:flagellar hook capping FlgD N-terminal domain-containing protein [Thiomicrospira sp.]MBE0494218.1 flagellar hook capping protein [Thiomicrospira sp.]
MSTIPSSTDFMSAMQNKSTSASQFAPQDQMGQREFLMLLSTQMMNQDPTKPMDPSSFVTDLTQMSQLEATQQLNKSVTSMTAGFQNLQIMQAAGLVGRAVVAEGDAFNHNDEFESHFRLDTDEPLSDVKIVISNQNGVVREMEAMGTLNKGETAVKWDGLNDDGGAAKSGTYDITAYGYDEEGNIKGIKTVVSTSVYSVAINADGSLKLTLSTGEKVDMSAVREIG